MGGYYSREHGSLYIYVTGGDPMIDLKLFPPSLKLFEPESSWRIRDKAAIVNDVEEDALDQAEIILNLSGFRRKEIQKELLESYYTLGAEVVIEGETSPGITRPPSPGRMPEP